MKVGNRESLFSVPLPRGTTSSFLPFNIILAFVLEQTFFKVLNKCFYQYLCIYFL